MQRRTAYLTTFAFLVMSAVAPAEIPPPGTMITKENTDKYRAVMFPSLEYFVQHGMEIQVEPYRRFEWPPKYKEATEKFAAQVKLTEDGRDMMNYVAGAPFPNIDPNDPLAAYKWMWNHEQKTTYSDNVGMGGTSSS